MIRSFFRNHKKAAWGITALIVANEIRGLIVVGLFLKAAGIF